MIDKNSYAAWVRRYVRRFGIDYRNQAGKRMLIEWFDTIVAAGAEIADLDVAANRMFARQPKSLVDHFPLVSIVRAVVAARKEQRPESPSEKESRRQREEDESSKAWAEARPRLIAAGLLRPTPVGEETK